MDCPLCLRSVELLTLDCDHSVCYRCLREYKDRDSGGCPKCYIIRFPFNAAILKKMINLSQRETEIAEQPEETNQCPQKTATFDTGEPGLSQGAAVDEELCESEHKRLKEKKERPLGDFLLEHTEGQTLHCESQIRAQFRHFYGFMKEEELFRLSRLRKEHQQKTETIQEELKKLEDKLGALSATICSVEQQQQGHSTERFSHMESLVLADEPATQLKDELLLDQVRHMGNLSFNVWDAIRKTVTYSPVILDPNTAHRELCLSEDLTSVRRAQTARQAPLNPERFTNYFSVVSSEGFRSGWHCWTVKVGDHPDWTIGVVNESVNRRAMCDVIPKNGFWCLTYRDDKYINNNNRTFRLKKRPIRIRIILHFDIGKLSFHDTKDMTQICSYQGLFTERMFPYFSVGGAEEPDVIKSIKLDLHDALSFVEKPTFPWQH